MVVNLTSSGPSNKTIVKDIEYMTDPVGHKPQNNKGIADLS